MTCNFCQDSCTGLYCDDSCYELSWRTRPTIIHQMRVRPSPSDTAKGLSNRLTRSKNSNHVVRLRVGNLY